MYSYFRFLKVQSPEAMASMGVKATKSNLYAMGACICISQKKELLQILDQHDDIFEWSKLSLWLLNICPDKKDMRLSVLPQNILSIHPCYQASLGVSCLLHTSSASFLLLVGGKEREERKERQRYRHSNFLHEIILRPIFFKDRKSHARNSQTSKKKMGSTRKKS